jgi:hypothetical protein
MSVTGPDWSVKRWTSLSVEAEPILPATGLRWPAWLNATVLLLVGTLAISVLSFRARPGAEVIAVAFPPLWNSQQVFSAVASSDALIVRVTALTTVVVVRPSDHDGLTRLRQAGAWLAIDPQAIAACMASITGKDRS